MLLLLLQQQFLVDLPLLRVDPVNVRLELLLSNDLGHLLHGHEGGVPGLRGVQTPGKAAYQNVQVPVAVSEIKIK